jgi:hypothetical protein
MLEMGVSKTHPRPGTFIPRVSVSQVAGITGVSHWCLAGMLGWVAPGA